MILSDFLYEQTNHNLNNFDILTTLEKANDFLNITKNDTMVWDKLKIKNKPLQQLLFNAFHSKNPTNDIEHIILNENKEDFILIINALARVHGSRNYFKRLLISNRAFIRAIHPYLNDKLIDATSKYNFSEGLKILVNKIYRRSNTSHPIHQ